MAGMPILSLVTYTPLLAAIIIALWAGASDRHARWTALLGSIASFIISIVALIAFNPGAPGMQFEERVAWLPELGISYHLGADGISILLLVLTTLLTML